VVNIIPAKQGNLRQQECVVVDQFEHSGNVTPGPNHCHIRRVIPVQHGCHRAQRTSSGTVHEFESAQVDFGNRLFDSSNRHDNALGIREIQLALDIENCSLYRTSQCCANQRSIVHTTRSTAVTPKSPRSIG
jgi:hypothetical protein